jgi:hypothetical protein
MTTPPLPDWYPDPSGKPGLMYWDGQRWHPDIPEGPSPAERPPSTTSQPQRHTALIAALVWIVAVLVVIVGITSYLLLQHPRASQTPTAQPAPPSVQTAQPAPPSSAVVPSATAPGGEVPGLAPFVGSWHAHKESLVIDASGHGHQTFSGGSVDFTLTSVSGDTATGSVTASSNTNSTAPGDAVTVTLVGNGQGLQLSRGMEQQFPYCNANATTQIYCGA